MASLKQLAGQTLWYGVSNIAARLLNYILTPIITYLLSSPTGMVAYGDMTMLYSGIAFINIIYTYGLETGYFRFAAKGVDKQVLFHTTFTSLLVTTLLLSTALILFRQPISDFIELGTHSEYIVWCVLIVAVDTLAAIPFARLRQENRPKKYAFTRMAGVFVNIILTVLLLGYCPKYAAENPGSDFSKWYGQYTPVGYILLANLGQAIFTFLLLYKEWGSYRPRFDAGLWKKILAYCWPMLIVGMGGMVNETIDRLMLGKLYAGSHEEQKIAVAIYGANYKIAIFITLFIQAFRMSAEPFFFNQSADRNAATTYARVMKWFVITLCFAFLSTALYIDVLQYFIGPQYRGGLSVVPILLAANVALGIYYNLSVWYKITDRMYMGMLITLVGAAITLIANYLLIPTYGMYACAWTTLAAYGVMMVLCYTVGQKYFPVNYGVPKLLGYLAAMLLLFIAQRGVMYFAGSIFIRLTAATVFIGVFTLLVLKREKSELSAMPVIGRWLK